MSLRYVLLFECLSKVATPHLARDLTPERFRKIDSDKWEFANKGFVRGKKHLLKSIQRRKSPQMQQGVGFGGSLEVGRAGFEDELNKLREERKILTREVAELQIEQDGTAQHMELVNQRIQVAERKQKQMTSLIQKQAEEKSALVVAWRGKEILKAEEICAKFRATRQILKELIGCF
ncbi:unnamed protein product [Rhodiola kirilowii]